MELRQLRYFVSVAERESFTRASADLLIAQPALSTQIAKLEDELGVALFERVGRRVRLTDAGRTVLEQARRALAAADDVAAAARLGAGGLVGRLSIGYIRSFPSRDMTRILRSFRKRRPRVALDLREGVTSTLVGLVRTGELDCAFVVLRDELLLKGLDQTLVRVLPAMIVVPSGHRFAKRRSIKLRELADDDWVIISRSVGEIMYDAIIAGCRSAGFAPRITQEVSDARMVLGFVAAGLGVSVVTSTWRELGLRGIHYVDLSPSVRFRFGVVTRSDATATVRALLSEIEAHAAYITIDRESL